MPHAESIAAAAAANKKFLRMEIILHFDGGRTQRPPLQFRALVPGRVE
jgi:hypothetical protein